MIAARAGDEAAVTVLLRAVWPSAFRLARSILHDSAAAEDAAQEACARAVGSLHDLRDPERFGAWMCRIVANEAKQRLRRGGRELSYDAVPHEAAIDETRDHDDRIDVRRAIERLDVTLRVPVVLRYYYGMNSAEIGRILSISGVTVRWRLMIAHRTLRAALASVTSAALPVTAEVLR